jgi:hypothetical protein
MCGSTEINSDDLRSAAWLQDEVILKVAPGAVERQINSWVNLGIEHPAKVRD